MALLFNIINSIFLLVIDNFYLYIDNNNLYIYIIKINTFPLPKINFRLLILFLLKSNTSSLFEKSILINQFFTG